MSALLQAPLPAGALDDPASEASRLLAGFQGNILFGHGRPHATHLFLNFADAAVARRTLRGFVSAGTAFALSSALERPSVPADGETPFVSVALSAAGYAAIGVPTSEWPADAAFRTGMRERGAAWIADSADRTPWEVHFRQTDTGGLESGDLAIHAMLILGASTPGRLDARLAALQDILQAGSIRVLGIERGYRLDGGDGRAIEHFGFRDGASNPAFVDTTGPRPQRWDHLAALSLALTPCPGGSTADLGSYIVFRKLAQDVRRFARLRATLARELGLAGRGAAARAGDLLVGRRADGTPLVPGGGGGTDLNDFDYREDAAGLHCPMASHVRKMNPRGMSALQSAMSADAALADERQHRIVRRGMSYGSRPDRPDHPAPPSKRPATGVGLLFICYQASIERQFEHLQRQWANSANFSPGDTAVPAGRDLLVGQGAAAVPAMLPQRAGALVPLNVESCITLKGGEYFFVPSLAFFRRL